MGTGSGRRRRAAPQRLAVFRRPVRTRPIGATVTRTAVALACGTLLAVGSIGLALFPNAFNPTGSDFNRNLHLTWFLGVSLQGVLVAGVWLLALQLLRPSASIGRMLLVVGVVFVLAVAVPCPAILNGGWADGLVGVYATLVWAGTALCVWVSPFGKGQDGERADPKRPAGS